MLGDYKAVYSALSEDPSLGTPNDGPCHWEPLLYVCFSRFAGPGSERAALLVKTAEALIGHGADPNANYIDPAWPDCSLPCLYGATGVNGNPNDDKSLYHSTEHADNVCLKLLLEH